MRGITNHIAWPLLAPWVQIEVYRREGGETNPRHRIELDDKVPSGIRRIALGMTMPCIECGKPIHPFRGRAAKSKRSLHQNIYYAAACPLSVNVGCSRGHAARDEYLRVKQAVEVLKDV